MPAHIHAESMIQYGHDALITDKPWELWECRPLTDDKAKWCGFDPNTHPVWNISYEYRRKQKTININGFEVPAQVREPLEVGTVYYVSSVLTEHLSVQYRWSADATDFRSLKRGLIHLTPEAAELHAKALLSFTACATAST